MAFPIPEILSDESKNYRVSIRLLPDGLSFSGYNPTIKGSFFLCEERWESSRPYAEQLKEFFFAHECLAWSYKETYIVQTQADYTLVPLAFYLEREKQELWRFNCGELKGKRVLANEVNDEKANLLYAMDDETYEFCQRSFSNPVFVHYLYALFPLWREKSLHSLSRQVYGILSEGRIDLACYHQGHLLFLNAFEVHSLNDMLYYILYVWKQHRWNALNDPIHLLGDAAVLRELKPTLSLYLKQVDTMALPSEAYLMGTDILRAPIDLIALYLYANNQW